MNLIINVNKPKEWTSFRVVKAVRKLLNTKKAGHLGTLDPLATGVLPIFLGKATKLIPFFNELDKEYRATFKLGERTDTFDMEGTIVETKDIGHITHENIKTVVSRYQGVQTQLTPKYSAVKSGGIPAYRLARQGKEVVRKQRTIQIESIQIDQIALPLVVIHVKCSKGTYIRSLVDDIGQDLNAGAHLVALERLTVGPHFSLDTAYDLDELLMCQQRGDPSPYINPTKLLKQLRTVYVSTEEQNRLTHGQAIAIEKERFMEPANQDDEKFLTKAIDSQDRLIAVGHTVVCQARYQFNPSKIFI